MISNDTNLLEKGTKTYFAEIKMFMAFLFVCVEVPITSLHTHVLWNS